MDPAVRVHAEDEPVLPELGHQKTEPPTVRRMLAVPARPFLEKERK